MKYVAGLFAVAFIGILVAAALKSPRYTVERSTVINAPAEKPFGLVNDFHLWADWSPWEKVDPAMKRDFSGATSGKGAVYAWEGNDNVGSGRMTIVESTPSSLVQIALEFIKPWAATNTTHFTFQPEGPQTKVTWSMSGESPFLGRIFCLFVSMDKMVGKDFEKGLAQLKAKAEAP